MMTTTLRAALIFVSLGTCCLIMRKIRQSKMQIRKRHFLDCAFSGSGSIQSVSRGGRFLLWRSGNLCNHKLFVSVCDFCFDCKGILYVCSYFSAGKPGKGAGSRIALDEKMRQEKEAEKTGGAHEK